MKKNIIYIGLLTLGVFLGWLLFGKSSTSNKTLAQETVAGKETYYTCSMHPSVHQAEPGNCPICGMALIPEETATDGLTKDQFKLTKNAMALANIQTSIVGEAQSTSGHLMLSGKIAENESANQVEVSYVSGRIEKLHVNFTGESVQKGQLLANIYSPELYAAQQELLTAAKIKETQPALYKAVRNKLKIWKLSETQIDQIEVSGVVETAVPIYATVSGTVTDKLVSQGDYIKQGQPLLKIANLTTVWAHFDVYENQINQFKLGQLVSVVAKSFPNKTFQGRVDFIDPVLDTKTRTVSLRVELKNNNAILKPGMFVTAHVALAEETATTVLTIPASAILWTGEHSVVYLKSEKEMPVFEMRHVKLGKRLGDSYEVVEGLFAGDEIVTNGTFTVDAAAQLQGKKSMMNGGDNKTSKQKLQVSDNFQQLFSETLEAYLKLKDAFVDSNTEHVSKQAKQMLLLLKGVLQENMPKNLKENLKSSLNMLQHISESKDVKEQREHFVAFNNNIIKVAQYVSGLNKRFYVQKCPMANNNQGATWLSTEKEIRNPYFGNAMLKCGEVIQIIE